MSARTRIDHPIPPTFDADSEVLILGSFPSVKSRESGYFYGHPQNRYWKVLAALFGDAVPQTVEEKRAFLLRSFFRGPRCFGRFPQAAFLYRLAYLFLCQLYFLLFHERFLLLLSVLYYPLSRLPGSSSLPCSPSYHDTG